MLLLPRFQGFIRTFILICGGVLVLQQFALWGPGGDSRQYQDFMRFFGLTPLLFFQGMIFQCFTWIFLHGSLMHFVFNALALWMFGSLLEERWGAKRMAAFMFTSRILSGIIVALAALTNDTAYTTPTIGASGVVFATLIAISRIYPDQVVLFFFVFPMRMRYFAYLMVLIEFYALYTSNQHGVSNIAHLGGALVGFLITGFFDRRGGSSGSWWRDLKDRWHHRRMRKKLRVIRVEQFRGGSNTYH